mgnify:CR=1 FL=1
MIKLGKWITKHRVIILIVAVVLLIPSVLGMIATRINYDMLNYLPDTMETIQGQDILLNDFGKGAFSMIIVEDMEPKDVSALKEKIEAVDHVDSVIWYDSIADVSIPMDILPDKIKDAFNTDHSTVMAVFFDTSTSADETMEAINPDVKVNTYRTFIDSENIMDIIKDYDFVIDGTDNFPAKFLINDACVMAKKPFSHAGIIRFKGQLMTYVPGQGPCYRCVFKNPPPKDAVPTCKQAGVIGAMGGVIGSLQAMEAIKYILGVGELLTGYLLTYDALKMEFRKVKLPQDTKGCAVCGENPTITELIDYEQAECDGVHL